MNIPYKILLILNLIFYIIPDQDFIAHSNNVGAKVGL